MSDSTTLGPPADLAQPGSFLHTVLTMSLTAIAVLRPLYGLEEASITDFAWVYLNPTGQRMIGQPARPIDSLLTLFPTAQADGVFDKCCRAFETGELQHNQTNYQADGLNGHFVLVAQRHEGLLLVNFTDTNDQPRSAVEVALHGSQVGEQTARTEVEQQRVALQRLNKELEERVRERTAQAHEQQRVLHYVLESVPAAIATLSGPQHRFSFANARYQYLVGNRVQAGLTVAEALPEVVEQGVIELLDRVYQTGEPFIGRGVMIMLEQPPGPPHQYYYDLTYLPLRDGQDQVQGILVFAVEVTEQVHIRRQATLLQTKLLAAAQHRAQERQDILQVFANAPLAVALLREPDHQLDYWNALLNQYFPGARRGVALQEVLPDLATPEVIAQLDRLYKNGETYQSEPTLLPGATPGASRRYVTFTYQAYREDGQVAGVALFLQDVTEQVLGRQQVQHLNEELTTTNQELLRSNTRLSSTNADLDTFIYTASHDLKAPITNIEGLIAALRQELAQARLDTTDVAYLLELMDGSVTRFQQTIGQLTGIVQLQQSGTWGQEQTDLARMLDDVRLDLASSLAATQAELRVEVTTCPTVRLSPKDLRSILYNLLSNALKYRAPDRTPVVQVRAHCDAQGTELRVQDNGLGLDGGQQAKLFGLFKRLHTHVEGSGVGLYSIKKLIENAGGTIRVESEAGVGSTFIVQLPA